MSNVNIPVPVGGAPLPVDYVPSIIAAGLYAGILVPLVIYRMTNRRSRTLLLLGTSIFSCERVVFFILRAIQAHGKSSLAHSQGVTIYMQNSLNMGFIGIANDLVNLLRCLLINPTFGSATFAQSPAAKTKGSIVGPPPMDTPDHPARRHSIRLAMGLLGPAFLAASIPGIIANADYSKALTNQSQADKTAKLRLFSTAIVPVLCAIILLFATWGFFRLSRLCKRGVMILYCIVALVVLVCIYRLTIIKEKATSLTEVDLSLNTKRAKAAFYIFHILPEWLAAIILMANNTRQIFGTGPLGDWRNKDETESQRRKREAKQAEADRRNGTIPLYDRVNNQSTDWQP